MAATPILRTRIVPPPIGGRTLIRRRVLQTLQEAYRYRLTLLHAGAGYGKSTALQTLAAQNAPVIWYQVSAEDNDPLLFLLYLCHATRVARPDLQGLPIVQLEAWDGRQGLLPSSEILYAYLNALSQGLHEHTLLILDDVHLVLQNDEIALLIDRLIGSAPAELHFFLATRHPVRLPGLAYWRSRGEVLDIDQTTLAFSPEEIGELFTEQFGYELAPGEAENLFRITEGWAITLPLIWQSLRSGLSHSVGEALAQQHASLKDLFELLAQDVLSTQPEDVREFLLAAATLESMTPPACDYVRQANDSAALLAYLQRQDLFVSVQADGSLRFHPVFRNFLRQRTDKAQRYHWHRRAAEYFQNRGELDDAVYHLLASEHYAAAADLLDSFGFDLLINGRLDSLASYLDALPAAVLLQHPALLCYLGDLARLHSRFDEALNWYAQAESLSRERGHQQGIARALRGQARVYLDTVRPARAESLLQQALRLSDGTEDRDAQARLYKLLAENRLNAGKTEEAEEYHRMAEILRRERPPDAQLQYRVLLRTGRLHEARRALEQRAEEERLNPVLTPRAHRETQLLLSIIYAFMGETTLAYESALMGTSRGEHLDSPYVTTVGLMRQGHALLIRGDEAGINTARQRYQEAIRLSEELNIPRLRVEAMMGLGRVYAVQGDLATAQKFALEGIEIASRSGDEWIASLVRIMLAGSLTLAGRYEPAVEWLRRARHGFRECSDPFGITVANLWLSLIWFRQQEQALLAESLRETLAGCREHGYDFLFARP
ncbi:MAG: transcriptional regulator, partial [Caldilineae bacterium]